MKMTPETFSAWPAEHAKLRELMGRSGATQVVEIGAFQGRTSVFLHAMGKGLWHDLTVIDPWDGEQDQSGEEVFSQFQQNTRGRDITVLRQRSASVDVTAWLGKCALVFIDGLHTYQGVKSDIGRFSPCCAPDGWLACHDYADLGWPGVRQAVDEHVAAHGRTLNVLHYFPTPQEIQRYGHGVSGLAFWQPAIASP